MNTTHPPKRPTGRRRGATNTRQDLLDAAAELFATKGYEGATLRAITAQAGVDVALVRHFFGDKEGLFAAAVMHRPMASRQLTELYEALRAEPSAARLTDLYLKVWESEPSSSILGALVRTALESNENRERLERLITERLAAALGLLLSAETGRSEPGAPVGSATALRLQLLAAQLLGIGLTRYVLQIGPLAAAPRGMIADQVEAIIVTNLAWLRETASMPQELV